MSVTSSSTNQSNSLVQQTSVSVEHNASTPPDMNNLSVVVQEWQRIHDEISKHREQVREKSKRVKILETIILNIMKQNNIGALDLKSSSARILYKKKSAKESLAPKTLQKLLAEHLKDEKAAADALKYVVEHRKTSIKEGLQYEKI